MPQRETQVQGLVHRRIQRTVGKFAAGKYVGITYQPHSHCLMHHGVEQDNVVGLKGDYGLEPRLLEKLLCNEPDAVTGTLQYKGSVPQVCQMDGLLLCQWVGGRQGHQ